MYSNLLLIQECLVGIESSNVKFSSQAREETEPGSWVLPPTPPLGSVPSDLGVGRLLIYCLLAFSITISLQNEFIYKPHYALDIMVGILGISHMPVAWRLGP